MRRAIKILYVILTIATLTASSTAQAAQSAIVFVLDSSNSMWSQVDGQNKVVHVRSVLDAAFGTLDGKVDAGLVSFGHREQNACKDIETVIPVGPIDREAYRRAVNRLNPKGATPIAASFRQAVQAATADGVSRPAIDLVMVFDGPDNCAGDPCRVAAELKEQHPGLRIHAVAFRKGNAEALQPLSCVATATGGTFFNATSRSELETAFNAINAVVLSTPAPPAVQTVSAPSPATPVPETPLINPMIATAGAPDASSAPVATPMLMPTLRADPATTGSLTETGNRRDGAQTGQALQTRDSAAASPDSAAGETVNPLEAVRQQIENEVSNQVGHLRLIASLTSESPPLESGLVWRVFSSKPDDQGNFRVVARKEDAQPVFDLKTGKYIIHAAYGRANATQEVDVTAGANQIAIVLNAGGLRLSSVLAGGGTLDTDKVNYSIFSSEVDEFGQRKLVLSSAPENLIIRLNSGTYHVVSKYGDANAVVRADVQIKPGQLTEATVSHHAAFITFKLVNQVGGEALAGTSWSILTPDGTVIVESVGAFPSYVLAAGTYSVLAQNDGNSFNRNFNVVAGRDQEVEVFTQ